MKKIIVSLLLMLLPIMVFADAGSPTFTQYSVRVKNPNGTSVERWNSDTSSMEKVLLPYDTIIEGIFYEDYIDGEMYGYYGDGSVKLSDCEVITKEFDFSTFYNTPGKLYVFKEGAYLYKGPSKVYGKVEKEIMLPVGATVEYKYSDSLFAYVTYKGVSGWVYYYQRANYEGSGPYKEGSSVATIEDGEVYITRDTKIYSDPVNGTELKKIIPSGEKVKYKYTYNSYSFVTSFYVNYKGVSGWVIGDNNNIARKNKNAKLYSYDTNVKICEQPIEGKWNEVASIPKDVMVDIEYIIENFDAWFYVTYNNKSGWIYYGEYEEKPYKFSYSYDVIELKNEVTLFNKIDGNEVSKLEKNKYKIYDFYIYNDNDFDNRWMYILDKDAWAKLNVDDYEYVISTPEESSSNEIVNKVSIKNIVLYSVIGACILSLVTVVTIKLVNKKKTINNDKINS